MAYDLVLFGATGFTGQLVAEYLARHEPDLNWALAGRNRDKLAAVRAGLVAINPKLADLPLLIGDSADRASLDAIVAQTQVVLSMVGPYALHGELLVAACADAGVDYADITGEPNFVAGVAARWHDTAVRTGARIVHCCGFDSLPAELGALFTVLQLPGDLPKSVDAVVQVQASFSGGTWASVVNGLAEIGHRPSSADKPKGPKREGGAPQKADGALKWDAGLKKWTVPMPVIDPILVRRSARARPDLYGPDFRYNQRLAVGGLATIAGLGVVLGGAAVLAQFKPTRQWLLDRKPSGAGPDAETRASSRFRLRFHGESAGKRVVTEVRGGDPGYTETSKMAATSAVLLLRTRGTGRPGGCLTSAVALGEGLITALQARGIVFEVLESANAA